MSKKKFGTNRQRVRFSGNQFDSSDLGHQYRTMGQQEVPRESISGIHLPAPTQSHSAYYNINRSNPNQFLVLTPQMWLPAPNPNFVPNPQISTLNHFSLATPHMWPPAVNPNSALTPQISNLNHFSLVTPHMWAPALNPNFAAHQGVRSPFVGPIPQPVHPPHQNRFALQPVPSPCHPYLMQSHPPYAHPRPVSSRQHALHNGRILPRIPSCQLPRDYPFIPCDTPPFHARDPPTMQTPTESCQCDTSTLPRENVSEVTATLARQAHYTDSTQNYSSPPTEAAVADKGPVASITTDEKTANENTQEPGLVASETASLFVLQWPGFKIEISKSPDPATLCELPENESAFYEWWEVAPDSSHPQSVMASLGLEVRESWDGLNLMLEDLSKSSDDTPSSPQSLLASENLEKYSRGSGVLETSFDQVRKMVCIALGNPCDISCMSSLFDVGAELTED